MQTCSKTGISIPECACTSCLQRLLDEFAPEHIRVRRIEAGGPRQSPITLITRRLGRRPSNSA
jgi:hypothetical protein